MPPYGGNSSECQVGGKSGRRWPSLLQAKKGGDHKAVSPSPKHPHLRRNKDKKSYHIYMSDTPVVQ